MHPFRQLALPNKRFHGRRLASPWRQALLFTVLTGSIGPALAQAESDALRAADPATRVIVPTVPAQAYTALPQLPAQPESIERARETWREVNDRVADFPRGHADVLRWEARQAAATETPAHNNVTSPPLDQMEAVRQALRLRPELFTRPDMNHVERARVQTAAAGLVRQVRQAWLSAVAARQRLALLQQAWEAVDTGTELGQRMVKAGSWSQSRLLREQLMLAASSQEVVRAQLEADAAQEQLARWLGLWKGDAVESMVKRLPQALAAIPPTLSAPPALEADAVRNHPTLATQRLLAERAIAGVRPERLKAWWLAADAALDAMPRRQTGDLPIAPQITDLSLARDHALERAINAEADLLLAATERRSQAREAWARVQGSHALAQHATDVLTKLVTLSEQETLLRYNGMLASSWDLLASARERIQTQNAAVQAQQAFWMAWADWQSFLAGDDYSSPTASSADTGTTLSAGGH